MDNKVVVIGGGLAGCEAAWQAAKVGCNVTLYEMRPDKNTGAHHTADLAEIVCSNSLGSNAENSAPGLLKEELRKLDSLIISCADSSRVAAGQALAVNRLVFSKKVTEAIQMNPNIEVIREEIKEIPCEKEDEVVVLATGPLTSDSMSKSICELIGEKHLYFFDAAAPIVDAESGDIAFTVTNTHASELAVRTVTKVWKDAKNAEKLRPKYVEVQLYKDGKVYGDHIRLDADKNWQASVSLPVYEAGKKIEWTIVEVQIPRYYSASYDQETLTVTNTIQSKTVPKTGDYDSFLPYMLMFGGCTVGAVMLLILLKKKRKTK